MADYTIYIIIALFVVLIIIAGFIVMRRRKKNKEPTQIPQDVLNEFNRAEELNLKYKGQRTPQQILWQINEERKHLFTLQNGEYEDKPIQPQPTQQPTQPQPLFKPNNNLNNLFRRRL